MAKTRGPMTASDLARRLGVSRQMIARYRAEGMPAERSGRAFLFDLAACAQWVHERRALSRSGGSRPGAGRPPSTGHGAEPAGETQVETIEQLVAAGASASPARMRVIAETVRIAKEATELRRRRGELLDAAEVRAAVGGIMLGVRLELEEIPHRVAALLRGPEAEDVRARAAEIVEATLHAAARRLAEIAGAGPC